MGNWDEGIRFIIRKYFGSDRVNTEEVSEMGKAEKGKQYGRNNIMNGRREILWMNEKKKSVNRGRNNVNGEEITVN